MAITPEQIKEIKKQLINQINSSFPDDKKAESISKIEEMNNSEILEFLENNNLIRDESGNPTTASSGNCLFCSIASEKIHSVKIDENENSIAVLEINPLSEGHTIVIPKEHTNKIPSETESFSKEIKERIKNSLKPKEVISEHSELFGHAIINLIPVYGDSMETERKKSTHEELQKIAKKINSSKIEEIQETKKETKILDEFPKIHKITDEKIRIPRRIP